MTPQSGAPSLHARAPCLNILSPLLKQWTAYETQMDQLWSNQETSKKLQKSATDGTLLQL